MARFQIAFILAALRSTADARDENRDRVELIWFPTGGGKTEAYLGLAAFSIFLRRLRDPADTGVQALMRYTLRLLTAQQFQRASRLVCAMEYMRRQNAAELGRAMYPSAFGSGDRRPRIAARCARRLPQSNRGDGRRKISLYSTAARGAVLRWGRSILLRRARAAGRPRVIGYEQRGNTVVYACPDRRCDFHESLPLYVIDEDIYERPPALVIGTVDKFAMLAWRPQARSLFWHRIGRYASMIRRPASSSKTSSISFPDRLARWWACTNQSSKSCAPTAGDRLPPSQRSSARRRRYGAFQSRCHGLYCAAIGPAFSLLPGSMPMIRFLRGSHAEMMAVLNEAHLRRRPCPGLGSLQTVQVRTFAALLQAPQPLAALGSRSLVDTAIVFQQSPRARNDAHTVPVGHSRLVERSAEAATRASVPGRAADQENARTHGPACPAMKFQKRFPRLKSQPTRSRAMRSMSVSPPTSSKWESTSTGSR